MTDTYTDRRLEIVTITGLGGGIHMSSGWTTGHRDALRDRLVVGMEVGVETRNLSTITGWLLPGGEWVDRKTDADLNREHEEMVAGFARQRREEMDKHRADWQARTDALPDWVRTRIESFREKSGEQFELDGWGYEMVIAELAVLYVEQDPDADEPADGPIMTYAREHGTSGNQHDFAKALARAHVDDPAFSLAGTVSALSPITGSADYS